MGLLTFGFMRLVFEWVVAIAGAAATIASDALMNPFDGNYPTLLNTRRN